MRPATVPIVIWTKRFKVGFAAMMMLALADVGVGAYKLNRPTHAATAQPDACAKLYSKAYANGTVKNADIVPFYEQTLTSCRSLADLTAAIAPYTPNATSGAMAVRQDACRLDTTHTAGLCAATVATLAPTTVAPTTVALSPPTTPSVTAAPTTVTVAPAMPPPTSPVTAAPPAIPTGDGSYTNSSGNVIPDPVQSPSGAPTGATAQCNDGTFSFSQHHSGTCSGHGGVKAWL